MELTAQSQTKVSSTTYMLYGDAEATIRHDPRAGLVAAFIFMSDIADEIDWEFVGDSPQGTKTNSWAMGINPLAKDENQTAPFTVADWHTYGFNWQPDQIQWKIDGNVIRTLTKAQAQGSFPQSPSRIQFSTWAGGNTTNPQGVIEWAGGAIDWTTPEYQQNGYYSHEIKSLSMGCAPTSTAQGIATTGSGSSITSYTYTGSNTSDDRPGFQFSTSPLVAIADPSADGQAGLPGWAGGQNPKVKNGNSWDGSGKQISDTVRAQSGAETSAQASGSPSSGNGSGSGDDGVLSAKSALKYGVPIAAAVIGLILIWAIALACYRRRRNQRIKSASQSGIMGGTTVTSFSNGAKGSAYAPLKNIDNDWEGAPVGAERKGQGYGPAVGPTSGPHYTQRSGPAVSFGDAPRTARDAYPMNQRSGGQQPPSQQAAAYRVPSSYQMRQQSSDGSQSPFAPVRPNARAPSTYSANSYSTYGGHSTHGPSYAEPRYNNGY